MAWRKFETHTEETKAVKQALKEAGINAFVGHGLGTSWGWLEINIGARIGKHHVIGDNGHILELTREEIAKEPVYRSCMPGCPVCKQHVDLRDKTMEIAQEVTGRTGEYHGNISILTQDHWDKKQNQSVPILQPFEEDKNG